jgi:hypothetical protein
MLDPVLTIGECLGVDIEANVEGKSKSLVEILNLEFSGIAQEKLDC